MEEKKERSSTVDLLWGAFIGALTGSVVALLLAPKKGTELRKDLSKQLTTIREKGEQLKQTLIDEGQIKEYAQEAKQKISRKIDYKFADRDEIAEKARKTITDISNEIEEQMEQLKEQ